MGSNKAGMTSPCDESGRGRIWTRSAAMLEDLEADLVTVGSYGAQALGERGVLLPLDRFSGTDGPDIEQEYYPNVLSQFRANGALYALPVGGAPAGALL